MIINRHNYEEFFLLYVDNELSESDRAAVEQFVRQNPDLAEEMEMLKQSVLPGENLLFEQKEILYNKENGIGLNNYEEYFLLAVDNELTKKESDQVEKFVLKHPELQQQYTILEQTRLQPEEIAFAGKDKLYRKERPVVFLTWMRVSVAAAVIGLIAMTWFFTQNGLDNTANGFVTVPKKSEKLPGTIQPVVPDSLLIERNIALVKPKTEAKADARVKAKLNVVKAEDPKVKKEVFAVNARKDKQAPSLESKVKEDKVTEMPTQDKKAFEQTIASARIDNSGSNVIKDETKDVKLTNKSQTDQNASIATHAVLREIDNQEDEERNAFYIGFAEINKNKLKGLFKKAGSFFNRKNNDNDDGKTLKIAGFEIKSK